MAWSTSDLIEIRKVRGKGRGVFARRAIREGQIIERAPVLVLPDSVLVRADGRPTLLADYCFHWGRGAVALALGYGSLYNHSYTPNALYQDDAPRTKVFRALRDIASGEEITINYHGDPEARDPVGFAVLDVTEPQTLLRGTRDLAHDVLS